MTANDWAAFILASLSTIGLLFAGLRWLIRAEFKGSLREEVRHIVKEELRIVNHELTNNGGSSTKDKIDYIYKKLRENDEREKSERMAGL